MKQTETSLQVIDNDNFKSIGLPETTPEYIAIIVYHDDSDEVSEKAAQLLNHSGYSIFRVNLSRKADAGTHADSEKKNSAWLINALYEHLISNADKQEPHITAIACGTASSELSVWLHDYAPAIKSAIFIAPNFNKYHTSGLTHFLLKSQKDHADDLFFERRRVMEDAAAITLPVLFILPQDRPKTVNKLIYHFYENLGARVKNIIIDSPGNSVHEQKSLKESISDFIISCNSKNHTGYTDLIHADKNSYTKSENEKFTRREASFFRRIYWKLNQIALHVAAQFSYGIRIGIKHGFDSGKMLDYVYSNTPQGRTPLHRLIDRCYLNAIPWRGARLREKHVSELILSSIHSLSQRQKEIRILDIASGHGKYIFDLPEHLMHSVDHVLMRDYDPENVAYGNTVIENKPSKHKYRYEQGDAFSPEDLATLPSDRTLAIASGFYELFDDNQMVLTSLKGIAGSLQEGGMMIYTGIPWHPRQEYMARVLTRHHDGTSWRIRRRTQQELDQLVYQAGFKKIVQRIDYWGIFSVSLAIKMTK